MGANSKIAWTTHAALTNCARSRMMGVRGF